MADTGNNRILEIHPSDGVIWEFAVHQTHRLIRLAYCKLLDDGHTLVFIGELGGSFVFSL